jgi:hypothetical protein
LLSVNATNTCPEIINPITDITVNEDSSISTIDISSVFDDADGQTLTYTIVKYKFIYSFSLSSLERLLPISHFQIKMELQQLLFLPMMDTLPPSRMD